MSQEHNEIVGEKPSKERVILSGLDVPFWDLVWFMVKLALASIPAMIILYFFIMAFGMLFAGCGAVMMPTSPGL